jgi:hypothetical protein
VIRSLLYLMATWPSIQFIVSLCAYFQASPHSSHWTAIQQIFRYLKYTLEFGIWYSAADFMGCGIDQKNTFGTCHFLGSSVVYWSTHKQSFVAQYTIEAEYVATTSYCSQILWVVHTMRDYGVTYKSVPSCVIAPVPYV